VNQYSFTIISAPRKRVLDYNELKKQVLNLLVDYHEIASDEMRRALEKSNTILSDKAMKMALLRYTRQGLLVRSKKTGVYRYRLTEKGSARRDWLSKTK
jgi:hypothetical protein